jgi:hypothetical protein
MVVPPYADFDMFDTFNHVIQDGTQICINILVRNGARTEQIYECQIHDKRHNLSLREVLLCSGDIQVLEREPLVIELFDEAVAT